MNRAQRRRLKSKKGAQYRRSRPTDNGRMNGGMKGRPTYK